MTDFTKAHQWLNEIPDDNNTHGRLVVDVDLIVEDGVVKGMKYKVIGHGGRSACMFAVPLIAIVLDKDIKTNEPSFLEALVQMTAEESSGLFTRAKLRCEEVADENHEDKKAERMDSILGDQLG